MKKFYVFIIFSLILGCFSGLTACALPKLDAPTGLAVDETTLELTWDSVEDARYYTVKLEGAQTKEYKTSKNNYSLNGVSAGNYTISVKACGKEGEMEDSDWSKSLSFVREKESGMALS